MGICEAVVLLADAVAEAYRSLNPRHALMVQILRSATLYRDAGRLDAWDAAFSTFLDDDATSPIDGLLTSIWELGEHNLYSGIDPKTTWDVYRSVEQRLKQAGIQPPTVTDLSDW